MGHAGATLEPTVAVSGQLASARRLATSQEALLLGVLIALCLLFALASDAFLTGRNLQALLAQTSMIAIVAVGMTLLITAGEIDLSVGSQQAFIGVLLMQTLNGSGSLVVGLLIALGVGLGIGLINAALTVGLGIGSFIVTLAMFSILRGGAYLSTDAAVQNQHGIDAFATIGNGFVWELPVALLIAVAIFVAFMAIRHGTTFGRYLPAVGGNPQAARMIGLPVTAVKVGAFVAVGVLSAVAATILASQVNSGQNNAGFGFELQVIAATLLGGTSLFGGRGSLIGTGLAVLVLATLNNGVVLLDIDSSWQLVLNGALILVALFMDARRRAALGEVSAR